MDDDFIMFPGESIKQYTNDKKKMRILLSHAAGLYKITPSTKNYNEIIIIMRLLM